MTNLQQLEPEYKRYPVPKLTKAVADDAEDAAWQALELAKDDILVDVCPLNETE